MENKKDNKQIVLALIGILAIVLVGVYALNQKAEKIDVENEAPIVNEEATAQESKDQEVKTETDTKINNTNSSTTTNKTMEKIAKNGDVLVMNYTGRLTDGTVFDSNVDPKFNHVTPFEFKLGAGMVIAGWDEGLLGMKVGEKKTLTISPEKGYGARGQGPIPPNATLIFDVELVAIK